MFNWSSYILLYPFLRCIFARLEAAILLFDFVSVQFSDIYIYYPTYLIHFLESPAISQVTRYLTDTKFILVVQSHNVVLS